MKNLTVEQSHQERQANSSIPLIDVRTPAEYGSLHAEFASNHPMESLDLSTFPFLKGQEIHVICQSGGRSMKVCQKLEAAGFEKVVNVEGGTSAWDAANLPVISGKKNNIFGETGANCRGRSGSHWSGDRTFCAPGWICSFRFRGCWPRFCRDYRYMWHGHVDCPDALEPGLSKILESFTRPLPALWVQRSVFFA